ncbi:MAG: hypothetical protein Q9191_001843 [Dirinaria sp. TL-2023a]
MAAFFTVFIAGFVSDKLKARGPIMICGCLLAIIGYILLLVPARPSVHYGGTFFVAAGTGFQIAIANCAAFIATFTYLKKDAPKYITGHWINVGFLIMSLVLSTSMILYAKWENRKRARGERDYRLAEGDEGLLGYRHPQFRYTI